MIDLQTLKSKLSQALSNITSSSDTNDAKFQILTITDNFFRKLLKDKHLKDFSYVVGNSFMEGDGMSVQSLLKGGPNTYWVDFSVKLNDSNKHIHDSITVYVNNMRIIRTPQDLLGIPDKMGVALKRTISSSGTEETETFPDFHGIIKK